MTYQVCYECAAEYPTARALRRAYRKGGAALPGRFRRLFVRASRVYFCPECLHDFLWAHQ